MKKSMIMIIFVVIVAVVAICAYLYLYPQKPVVFEAIVPDSAIYYISTSNLNKKFKDFKNSTFFLGLSETAVYKNKVGPAMDDFNSKAPFLKDFIEKDIALAVLSLGKSGALASDKKYDMENTGDILLLIRVDRNKLPQLKRSIGEAYIAKHTGGLVSKEYQGVRISSYRGASGEQALNYAIISDTVLVSNSLEDIQKSVDLFKKRNAQSLANNTAFRTVTARVKKDSLFWGYQSSKNYEAEYLRQLEEAVDPWQKMIMSQLKPLMNLMAAIQDQSFYVDYDREAKAFVLKAYIAIDASKDETGLASIISRNEALGQKAFSLIPDDALAYCAFNQDMLKCWDFWMNLLSKLSFNPTSEGLKVSISPDAMVRRAEYYLGLDLRKDLIALLGDDFGLVFASLDEVAVPLRMPSSATAMSPQNINRNVSVPQVYLFCGVKDTLKLGKTMEGMFQKITENINKEAAKARERFKKAQKTTPSSDSPEAEDDRLVDDEAPAAIEDEKPPASFAVEKFKDVDIHYLAFSDSTAPLLEPNYCIVDKYLVFSLSRGLTKKIIQTSRSSSGWFDFNTRSSSIRSNLLAGYSAVFFLDFQAMLNRIGQSSSFKSLRPTIVRDPKLGLSSEDLGSLLTALGTMHQLTVTVRKVPGEDVLESQALLTIQE